MGQTALLTTDFSNFSLMEIPTTSPHHRPKKLWTICSAHFLPANRPCTVFAFRNPCQPGTRAYREFHSYFGRRAVSFAKRLQHPLLPTFLTSFELTDSSRSRSRKPKPKPKPKPKRGRERGRGGRKSKSRSKGKIALSPTSSLALSSLSTCQLFFATSPVAPLGLFLASSSSPTTATAVTTTTLSPSPSFFNFQFDVCEILYGCINIAMLLNYFARSGLVHDAVCVNSVYVSMPESKTKMTKTTSPPLRSDGVGDGDGDGDGSKQKGSGGGGGGGGGAGSDRSHHSISRTRNMAMRWTLVDFEFVHEGGAVKGKISEEMRERILLYRPVTLPEDGGSGSGSGSGAGSGSGSGSPTSLSDREIEKRDMYAFARMVHRILIRPYGQSLTETFPSSFPLLQDFIHGTLTSTDPLSRPAFTAFLSLGIFRRDPFCSIMSFLDFMRVRQPEEKKLFWVSLRDRLRRVKVDVVKRRIIPRLLSLSMLTEEFSMLFWPALFTPKGSPTIVDEDGGSTSSLVDVGLLDREEFKIYIVSFVKRMFGSRIRAVRLRSLQLLSCYLFSMPAGLVFKIIIPNVMLSLSDVDDEIVTLSITAILFLARYCLRFDDTIRRKRERSGMESLPALDEDGQLVETRGLRAINRVMLPMLHHWAVFKNGDDSIRPHAILCAVEMWRIPGIRKELILSIIEEAAFDNDYEEIIVHLVNCFALHFMAFTLVEIVTLILPILSRLCLHSSLDVRVKAFQLSSRIHSELLRELTVELPDDMQPPEYISPISILRNSAPVRALFPESSRKKIFRRKRFRGPTRGDVVVRHTPRIQEEESEGEVDQEEAEEEGEDEDDDDWEEWDVLDAQVVPAGTESDGEAAVIEVVQPNPAANGDDEAEGESDEGSEERTEVVVEESEAPRPQEPDGDSLAPEDDSSVSIDPEVSQTAASLSDDVTPPTSEVGESEATEDDAIPPLELHQAEDVIPELEPHKPDSVVRQIGHGSFDSMPQLELVADGSADDDGDSIPHLEDAHVDG